MLRIVGVAVIYKIRPSVLLSIDDPYTAFCLDEACAFIYTKLQNGEEPVLPKEEGTKQAHYSSPSQLYKKFDN